MRSGTLCFNKTVFSKTVRRFWPLWTLWLLLWMLVMPLSLLMGQRYGPEYLQEEYLRSVEAASELVLVFVILYAAVCAMAVLSHLYNSRSANFFASLPVRREGMFLTQYLAGLAFAVVPALVTALLMFLVGLSIQAEMVGAVWYWFLMVAGEYLFFFSFAVFCGMFAGHILALPAYYAIFNVLAASLYSILEEILRSFYYGFYRMPAAAEAIETFLTPALPLAWVQLNISTYSTASAVDDAIYYGTAVNTGAETYTAKLTFDGGAFLAGYAVAGLVLALVAFLLYRVRNMETAGDVVAVAPMKPVFRHSVAFCAGLFFGYGTNEILSGDTVSWMVCTVVWAVVGSFVAQMILDKSFRVFRKWKGAAAAAGAFCILFLVIALDLTGFESRIPAAEDVKSVELRSLYTTWDLGDSSSYSGLTLTDPEQIEDIICLHRGALAARQEDDEDSWYRSDIDLIVTYHLKSGGSFSRSYAYRADSSTANQEGSPMWALRQLYQDKDLIWRAYGFDDIDADGFRLSWVSYTDDRIYQDEELAGNAKLQALREYCDMYGAPEFTGADAAALLDAVKADIENGNLGQRNFVNTDSSWDNYRLKFRFYDQTGDYQQVTVTIQDNAEEVHRLVDALLEERLEEFTHNYGGKLG